MKKYIAYFFSFLLFAFFNTKCTNSLEIAPRQNITPDQITTADDVKALLFGNYSLMQRGDAFGEKYMLVGDLLASEDQIDFVGTYSEYKDIQNKEQIASNYIPFDMWSTSYQIINQSNLILSKIDLINEEERDAIAAEAKFFRGVTLFELVNFFAQPYSAGNVATNLGVPVPLVPVVNYDTTTHYVRASVQEVYQQVLSDLTEAANALPETNENARATKYVAKAFLSRVYLNMADYANAARMANEVIESGNFTLSSNYTLCFNNDVPSSEDIFSIQQNAQSNAGTSSNGLTTFYASNDLQPAGRGDVQVNPSYLDYFLENDVRGTFFYDGSSISGISGIYTTKWKKFYKTIPVIRLSEMYLTRGEANLKAGTSIGATPLDDINIVRGRAGTDELNSVTENDFIDERFRELGFEGDRLWTLKRLKKNIDGYPYNHKKLVLPIPQREIDANPYLIQNEGY